MVNSRKEAVSICAASPAASSRKMRVQGPHNFSSSAHMRGPGLVDRTDSCFRVRERSLHTRYSEDTYGCRSPAVLYLGPCLSLRSDMASPVTCCSHSAHPLSLPEPDCGETLGSRALLRPQLPSQASEKAAILTGHPSGSSPPLHRVHVS